MFIELTNIKKTYKTKYNETNVLKGLNLKVEKGDLLAIIGSSGCGKSTLLNILGAIDTFDEGSYKLYDKDINLISEKEKALIRNSKIGFIYQNFALIDELSVLDNVIVPLKVRKIKNSECKNIALNALSQVGLSGMEKKKVFELSGGQRQRVAIARTIAQDTNIILADEPTGSLDKNTGKEILKLLLELNKQGKTIIIVTHDLELAACCTRKLKILDGNIVEFEKNILL